MTIEINNVFWEEEKTLSSYIINLSNLNNKDVSVIPVNRVKEFIKRLKKLINDNGLDIDDKIDKLAGDKLK